MPDRTKLLIHVSRLAQVIRAAHRQGPDPFRESTILAAEQPEFVHYSTALYLAGCLAFLEGEDGAYSWTQPSPAHADFDSFVASHPPGKTSFLSRGISSSALNALACIRNAVTHNNGDLAKNRNKSCLALVSSAGIPDVTITGTVPSLPTYVRHGARKELE